MGTPKRETIEARTRACRARPTLYLLALITLAGFALPGLASAAPGELSFAQCIDDNDSGSEAACPGADGLFFAFDVAVSPDGGSVYVVSDQDAAIVRFDRNLATGALTFAQCFVDATQGSEAACPRVPGLHNVEAVAVSPDGKSVYVASPSDRAVVRFDRNPGTGALSFGQCIDDNDTGGEASCPGVDGLHVVNGLAVSPDGKSLYSIGEALVHFDRNTTTGALNFAECFDDNDADPEAACVGVDGGGGDAVVVSPDGKSVYTSGGDEAVVGFDRDATTGAVGFAQCIDDNDTGGEAACPGVDGLGGFLGGLAVSPDGSSLYAASTSDDAVVVFDRATTGALSFAQCIDDNDTGGEAACPGVDGLQDPRALTLAPDGSALYLVSFTDSALVRFSRASNGILAFAQCLDDDDLIHEAACPPVPALSLATSVAASADGKSVYVTADDAISRFDVEATTAPGPDPTPSPEPQPVPGGEGQADRTLTIDANKGKVKKGKKVTLTGQIDAPTNESGCAAGQSVALEAKAASASDSAFEAIETVQTDASGNFSLTLKMKKTRAFRAVVSETSACRGEVSNVLKVKAQKA